MESKRLGLVEDPDAMAKALDSLIAVVGTATELMKVIPTLIANQKAREQKEKETDDRLKRLESLVGPALGGADELLNGRSRQAGVECETDELVNEDEDLESLKRETADTATDECSSISDISKAKDQATSTDPVETHSHELCATIDDWLELKNVNENSLRVHLNGYLDKSITYLSKREIIQFTAFVGVAVTRTIFGMTPLVTSVKTASELHLDMKCCGLLLGRSPFIQGSNIDLKSLVYSVLTFDPCVIKHFKVVERIYKTEKSDMLSFDECQLVQASVYRVGVDMMRIYDHMLYTDVSRGATYGGDKHVKFLQSLRHFLKQMNDMECDFGASVQLNEEGKSRKKNMFYQYFNAADSPAIEYPVQGVATHGWPKRFDETSSIESNVCQMSIPPLSNLGRELQFEAVHKLSLGMVSCPDEVFIKGPLGSWWSNNHPSDGIGINGLEHVVNELIDTERNTLGRIEYFLTNPSGEVSHPQLSVPRSSMTIADIIKEKNEIENSWPSLRKQYIIVRDDKVVTGKNAMNTAAYEEMSKTMDRGASFTSGIRGFGKVTGPITAEQLASKVKECGINWNTEMIKIANKIREKGRRYVVLAEMFFTALMTPSGLKILGKEKQMKPYKASSVKNKRVASVNMSWPLGNTMVTAEYGRCLFFPVSNEMVLGRSVTFAMFSLFSMNSYGLWARFSPFTPMSQAISTTEICCHLINSIRETIFDLCVTWNSLSNATYRGSHPIDEHDEFVAKGRQSFSSTGVNAVLESTCHEMPWPNGEDFQYDSKHWYMSYVNDITRRGIIHAGQHPKRISATPPMFVAKEYNEYKSRTVRHNDVQLLVKSQPLCSDAEGGSLPCGTANFFTPKYEVHRGYAKFMSSRKVVQASLDEGKTMAPGKLDKEKPADLKKPKRRKGKKKKNIVKVD